MDQINVRFGSLSQGASGIMATYRALQGTLEDLEKKLQPMVSSWNGTAQEAYYQKKTQWEQASNAMAVILQQMGQAVSDAHDNYTSAEKSNTGIWS